MIQLRDDVILTLKSALDLFVRDPRASLLIPEVGTNIGYALPDAKGLDEVAAVPGRISLAFGKPIYCLPPAFGASDHVTRVILTAMKFDPPMRSAINLRFVEGLKGEDVYVFDRSKEPPDSAKLEGRTMNFMVESAFKSRPRVRYILDVGAHGKEPSTFVISTDPVNAVKEALSLAEMIK
jgi:predicted fused transcriptional regulator/phosphomethylpyrimidine kinase